MRKQEYIHVHALFVEIARYLVEQEGMPTEVLAEYEALDTRPSSVGDSKRDHHEAVMTLAAAIDAWLERAPDAEPDIPAP